MSWTQPERDDWERQGYFFRRSFVAPSATQAMLDDAVGLARRAGDQFVHEGTLITPESNLRSGGGGAVREGGAELGVSKIFKLHRRRPFLEFIGSREVIGLLCDMLGGDVDCFLSQFIFKNPGAWGQPWHQDSHYFRFDAGPQVGLWVAVTEATLENGCLHVLPGSHREPVHEHVIDRRPGANFGYVEIVDHEMDAAVPVLMKPGDLLVFHSHLMHMSTDNDSESLRAAMVYHAALHGTRDLGPGPSPVNDWMRLTDQGEAA